MKIINRKLSLRVILKVFNKMKIALDERLEMRCESIKREKVDDDGKYNCTTRFRG